MTYAQRLTPLLTQCSFGEAMELLRLKPNMQSALLASSVAAEWNPVEQTEKQKPEEQDQEEQNP